MSSSREGNTEPVDQPRIKVRSNRRTRLKLGLVKRVLCFLLCACGSARPTATGTQWEAADAIFHSDPRWLGADAAYSIDLGNDRSLWLFGDTLVAKTSNHTRAESTMVRNSIAVQTGRDPTKASIAFAWGPQNTSFFPDSGDAWSWPSGGVRVPNGPLVVFLSSVKRTKENDPLGFAYDGWRVAIVDRPEDAPSAWNVRYVDGPPADAFPATAVRDSGFVFVLFAQPSGSHDAFLARMDEHALASGTIAPEWWTGDAWSTRDKARVVIESAGTECSLHFDAGTKRWVHVTSRGFGATTIAVRISSRIEGPWSEAVDAYRPPESKGARPLVYAAKAHPELDGSLAVTYATNSFDFWTLFKPEGATLYYPRFVRIELR